MMIGAKPMDELEYDGDPVDLWVALAELTARPAWWDDAACRGAGLATFFPETGGRIDDAKSLCARCPARQPCFEAAMAEPLTSGVWAGTSAAERRRLRRAGRTAA
jgi:WhiB family redox-sensing transcriptional regulator